MSENKTEQDRSSEDTVEIEVEDGDTVSKETEPEQEAAEVTSEDEESEDEAVLAGAHAAAAATADVVADDSEEAEGSDEPIAVEEEEAESSEASDFEGDFDPMDFLESQLESARAEVGALKLELEQSQKLAQQKDAARVRLQADFDNFRRRQEREVQRLQDEKVEKVLLRVLPVYDTFGRAIDQYEKDNSEDALYTGLQMIEKMFKQLLEQQGITPIEAAGKPFDPNLHDAVCRVVIPEDGFDEMVVDVFETGYILGDKVLKPAKVSVAKD